MLSVLPIVVDLLSLLSCPVFSLVQGGREFKRLEAINASPIFSHFGETLNGVSSIWAFGAQSSFVRTLFKRLDAHHGAYLTQKVSEEWLRQRLAVLTSFMILGCAIMVILLRKSVGPAMGGLAITFML